MSQRRRSTSRSVPSRRRSTKRAWLRLVVLGVAGLALIYAIATRSLPEVIATTNPDLALRLSPNHSDALLAKAEDLRAKLLALSDTGRSAQDATAAGEGKTPADQAQGHASATDRSERAALRAGIETFAKRAIQSDPLNARAFRLLGEVAPNRNSARVLMQAAVARSRRESIAVFWLLTDSLSRQDFAATLDNADVLMRSRPQLVPYVMSYLGQMAESDEARPLLLAKLASLEPKAWRGRFVQELPRYVRDVRTPLKVMQALKEAGQPPSASDLNSYLSFLIAKNFPDLAYYAWLQFLPEAELSTIGLVTNGNFERTPSGVPFDWRIATPRNATAEIRDTGDARHGKALHISFGSGRVRFPAVTQLLMLSPGRYTLSAAYRGEVVAKRGLRWRLACAEKPGTQITETEMIAGKQADWTSVTQTFDVPADCRAQTLSLIHDARSASEELISGTIVFDDVRIDQVSPSG